MRRRTSWASLLVPAQISLREARKAAVCPGCLRRARMPRPCTAARAGSASSGSSAGATPALRRSAANSAGALRMHPHNAQETHRALLKEVEFRNQESLGKPHFPQVRQCIPISL